MRPAVGWQTIVMQCVASAYEAATLAQGAPTRGWVDIKLPYRYLQLPANQTRTGYAFPLG